MPGDRCDRSAPCRAGTRCVPISGEDQGICTPEHRIRPQPPQPESAFQDESDPAPDQTNDPNPSPLAGTSVDRPSLDYPLGDACETNRDCHSLHCEEFYEGLSQSLACVPRDGTGREGEYCHDSRHCEGDMVCRAGNRMVSHRPGSCSPPFKELGASCFASYEFFGTERQFRKTACESRRCDMYAQVCIPQDGAGLEGQYCRHPHHCASGICVAHSCREEGTAELGEMCAGSNTVCISGVCDQTPGKARLCVPDLRAGQDGEFCSDDSQCASSKCENRACVGATLAVGSVCANDTDCASSRCDTQPPHLCIPRDGTGIAGNYCSHPNQCESGICGAGRCREAGVAQVGELCFGYDEACKYGNCDGSRQPARCVPDPVAGGLGDYCTQDGQCSTLRCDATYGCMAAGKGIDGQDGDIGSACTQNEHCIHGRCDVAGVCIPNDGAGLAGQTCSASPQCQPGLYCDLQGITAVGTCRMASR